MTLTEGMTLNMNNPIPKLSDGNDLHIKETSIYLGGTIRDDGGTGNNIRNRLNKARK